jgi:hypothetical protein
MSKYHAKKITKDGMTFDSMKEYRRWNELVLLQKAGRIQDLDRQVKFVLIPAQYEPDTIGVRGGVKRGKLLEREISYMADFVYTQDGKRVVEDSKGFRTTDYKMKRKMMLYFHGIRIKET